MCPGLGVNVRITVDLRLASLNMGLCGLSLTRLKEETADKKAFLTGK